MIDSWTVGVPVKPHKNGVEGWKWVLCDVLVLALDKALNSKVLGSILVVSSGILDLS